MPLISTATVAHDVEECRARLTNLTEDTKAAAVGSSGPSLPPPAAVRSTPVERDRATAEVGCSGPSSSPPADVRPTSVERDRATVEEGAGRLAATMESAYTCFLADIRQDLGLPTAAPVGPDGRPALEAQLADLRKRQEALEALWADESWKHRGKLVDQHVASLATGVASSTADAAGIASYIAAAKEAAGTEGAPRVGRLPRPLVSQGLLYV